MYIPYVFTILQINRLALLSLTPYKFLEVKFKTCNICKLFVANNFRMVSFSL